MKAAGFALIAIVLLFVDARMQLLVGVRQVAATALYPLQVVALMPRQVLYGIGDYFSSVSALEKELKALKDQQLVQAQQLQQARFQAAENGHLRRLMNGMEQLPVPSLMAEILYDARDPAIRRIVINRGTNDNVELGLPVIDYAGVVGQVTRVFPFTSEVTLLTDRDQAIPVQVLRSGLRAVAYGGGQLGHLDLRFVAPDADIQVGDILVTSGLDGMYPAGLAVARVAKVERSAGAFSRISVSPLAGIDRHRQVLVIMSHGKLPPRPESAAKPPVSRRNLPAMVPVPAAPLTPSPLPAAGGPTAAAAAASAAAAQAAAAQAAKSAPSPAPTQATPRTE